MSTRYCDALTTRELLAMLRQASQAATSPAVPMAVTVLTGALHGGALQACQDLQDLADRHATGMDRELYGAAIALGSALWHVETGTDATPALDAALKHLRAALDAHEAVTHA